MGTPKSSHLSDPAGTRTQDPPDKIGMLYPFEINSSIYFLDFMRFILSSNAFAS